MLENIPMLIGERIIWRGWQYDWIMDSTFSDTTSELILTNMRILTIMTPSIANLSSPFLTSIELVDYETHAVLKDKDVILTVKSGYNHPFRLLFKEDAKHFYEALLELGENRRSIIEENLVAGERIIYKYQHTIKVLPSILPSFEKPDYTPSMAFKDAFYLENTIVAPSKFDISVRLLITNQSLILYELDPGWRIHTQPRVDFDSHNFTLEQPCVYNVRLNFTESQVTLVKKLFEGTFLEFSLKRYYRLYGAMDMKSGIPTLIPTESGATNWVRIYSMHKKKDLEEILSFLQPYMLGT